MCLVATESDTMAVIKKIGNVSNLIGKSKYKFCELNSLLFINMDTTPG